MSVACQCNGGELPVYGKLDGRRIWTRTDGSELRAAKTLEQAQHAMGIDWMAWGDLTQAIPPAYTEHIGGYLMSALRMETAA
jgi:DNA (cytosine-5)-methyltransferase 1